MDANSYHLTNKARGITNSDGKARVKESPSLDGDGKPWYVYYFSAADFLGEIAGRAPNAQMASYSFKVKGKGSFYLPGNKNPQVSCGFGTAPWF